MKILDFIFGLSSLLALVITIVNIFYNYGHESQDIASIMTLTVANISLIIIIVYLVRKYYVLAIKQLSLQPDIDSLTSKLELATKDLDNTAETSDILHSINDQLRNRMFELLTVDIVQARDISGYQRKNEMFYLFLLDNIKNIFDILTKDNCSVSLKIIDQNDQNDIIVRTFMRDSSSYRERKNSDKTMYSYPYYENSAFKDILSDNNNISYYVSDNLSNETTYINVNQNWKEYYNATLVCPIRVEVNVSEDGDLEYSIPGFLCIDNMNGNLNNARCINLLASLADILFIHWYIYDSVKCTLDEKLEKENEND